MRLEESIMHAIDGNAVLFLGAGFNSGAINFNDERFPLGNELCQRIIEDGNIMMYLRIVKKIKKICNTFRNDI